MQENREQIIVRTSAIGIAANLFLSLLKAIVGLMANSISIILDAVNNMTDALSSVVTIIGTKLAGKPADKKHPFGHGRAEYLSALIIAIIILYAGFTSLIESVKKIIFPSKPEYEPVMIAVISIAVVVKIALGLYVKATGKKVNSDSLKASGQDALMDSVISFSTLITALVFVVSGISLEAFLGVVISFFIIKSGIDTLRETLSKILGERIDPQISHAVKKTIVDVDKEILGAYDLVLNNYGPDRHLGSVHIEVPGNWSADKIDLTTRRIQSAVYEKHNILMTAVGVYSVNTTDRNSIEIRSHITDLVTAHDGVLQLHGFFIDSERKQMRFDVVISFEVADMKSLYDHVVGDVRSEFPDYNIQVQFDTDISD